MAYPKWLKGWSGIAIYSIVGLFVLYGAYALFVSMSNGSVVEMNIHVGTKGDGTMYLRCGGGSSPGVCTPGGTDQATFHLHTRDRVRVTVVNDDGGDHTHDIRLGGGAYWLWPAGFENELDHCPAKGSGIACATETFTAWSSGAFDIDCEISGHKALGMHGTLIVD